MSATSSETDAEKASDLGFHESMTSGHELDISIVRLTDRRLEEVGRECGFDRGTIRKLPEGAVLADFGSGTHQAFLREAKEINPGIKTLGIDASLAIPVDAIESGEIRVIVYSKLVGGRPIELVDYIYPKQGIDVESMVRQRGGAIYYPEWQHGVLLKPDVAKRFHSHRLEQGGEVNAVVMHLPEVGLADKSVDMLVDCNGPMLYMGDDYIDGKKRYLKEVCRVLKPGGRAYIAPLISDNLRMGYNEHEGWGNDAVEYGLKKHLEETFPNIHTQVVRTRASRNNRDDYSLRMVVRKRGGDLDLDLDLPDGLRQKS